MFEGIERKYNTVFERCESSGEEPTLRAPLASNFIKYFIK